VESGIANLEMAVTEASMELLSSLLDELIKNKSCSDAADIIKDKTDLFDKKYGPVRDVLYRLLKQMLVTQRQYTSRRQSLAETIKR